TGSADRTARLWDVATGHEVGRFIGHLGELLTVAVSRDGRLALTGGKDRTVHLWEIATRTMRQSWRHTQWVDAVAFSPDSQSFLTSSHDGIVALWDVKTGSRIRTFHGDLGITRSI